MKIQRKLLIILTAVAALLVAGTMGTRAGARFIEGNIRSFVVNIAQSVPIEISAPIKLDNGEMVTVTAPITVNVELRVSVDGKGEAKVIEKNVQEPTITVTEAVVTETTDAVEISDLAWRITSQENLGSRFDWDSNVSYSTSGMFIRLGFELENQGDEPVKLSPFGEEVVVAFLIDERERQFAELDYGYSFDEICYYTEINPGLTESCVMVFEVAKNVESLTLHLTREDETVEIPLTIVD